MLNSTVRGDGALTTPRVPALRDGLDRSGGTLVTMSASPFSSATRRGKSSGIAFHTTRSIAGALPSQPHQSRLASITSRSSFTHSTNR